MLLLFEFLLLSLLLKFGDPATDRFQLLLEIFCLFPQSVEFLLRRLRIRSPPGIAVIASPWVTVAVSIAISPIGIPPSPASRQAGPGTESEPSAPAESAAPAAPPASSISPPRSSSESPRHLLFTSFDFFKFQKLSQLYFDHQSLSRFLDSISISCVTH